MDWNHKNPMQWDWENLALFSGKESEISKSTGQAGWNTEVAVISNSSIYSSGSGTFSISDLCNCSSKSSISVSVGSSPKVGNTISEVNFEAVEGLNENQNINNECDEENITDASPTLVRRVSAAEPPIGLKLGKRTYFENLGAATSSVSMTQPTAPVKRSRAGNQASQLSCCQAEGCFVDLSLAKDYHRKHRVCESHSKSPKIIVSGQECRFCQQCSRFHDLSEFDQKKRSCRRRLYDHNARRRKPQPDSITSTSSGFSSSSYAVHADERQQMDFFRNLAHSHVRGSTSSLWDDSHGFSLSMKKGSWINSAVVSVDGQFPIPNPSNTVSVPRDDFDKRMPFKGTATKVLNHGMKASVPASNIKGAQDLQCALSLLSSDSWVPPCSKKSSTMNQFADSVPAVGSHPPNLLMDSEPECWQVDHFLADPALNFRLNGSQMQDYNLSPLFEANGQFVEFKT